MKCLTYRYAEHDKHTYTRTMEIDGEVVQLKNPIRRARGDIYILLNHGKEAIVTEYDYFEKKIYNIHLHQSRFTTPAADYPVTDIRDSNTKTGRNTLKLYEIILGKIPGFVIDHINGDHFDCRRWNLRHGTQAQNNRNRHKMSAEECYWRNPDRHFPEAKLF